MFALVVNFSEDINGSYLTALGPATHLPRPTKSRNADVFAINDVAILVHGVRFTRRDTNYLSTTGTTAAIAGNRGLGGERQSGCGQQYLQTDHRVSPVVIERYGALAVSRRPDVTHLR